MGIAPSLHGACCHGFVSEQSSNSTARGSEECTLAAGAGICSRAWGFGRGSAGPWPFPASLMIGCVAEATSTKILVDPKEIESAIWVSREEMLEVFSGNNQFMYPARKGSIAHFMIKKWMMGNIK